MAGQLTPGTAAWDRVVARGRDAVRRTNWLLGDDALLVAPMGEHGGVRRGDQEEQVPLDTGRNLARYAEEIGVNVASLQKYRKVAAAWPVAERVEGTCWKTHQILAAPENKSKIRPGMTVTQAHEVAGHSTVSRERVRDRAETYTADQVRELVEEAVGLKQYHEPDHADFLGVPTSSMSDDLAGLLCRDEEDPEDEEPTARVSTTGPATDHARRQAEQRRLTPEREPASVATLQDLIDSERVNDAILRLVERIRAGHMDAMPSDIKEEAAGVFRTWRDALDWAIAIIEGGAVTDAALADFLDAQS